MTAPRPSSSAAEPGSPAAEPQDVARAAAERGALAYKSCEGCGRPHYYPRPLCPFCLSAATRWREASGGGSVYSLSIVPEAEGARALLFVTLDEGFTILSAASDDPAEAFAIGARVRVVFRPDGDGVLQPFFRLDDAGD
ncbi:MAG: OB-fold domain-containing protein [Alphaproteobacteria bacterium]|nr:OB-fold domain-containing protein [Alphaproteobacteria bacterium]